MNLLARGKVLKQDGDMATIQLSNEELGRAVLGYVVNNVDGSIGEKFMQNLFAGKPMSLNDLLLSNVVEAKKVSELNNNGETKVEDVTKFHVEVANVEDTAKKEEIKVEVKNEASLLAEGEDDEFKIELLKEQAEIKVRILDIKETCQNVYERVVKTKNGISSQIIANCDIVFTLGENNVTYSFISYKKEQANVITPNNNLVFIWEDAKSEELDELISLI